uniref:RNA polymerase II-associated protein 1 n=1 Tax=Clastoptera arizonana TaxID=38151 RepID=A0A1B6CGL5_9HEMI
MANMEPRKKPSLFAQRMLSKNREKSRHEILENHLVKNDTFGDKSYVITGQDAESIHNENVTKLSALTSKEIEEERNKLLLEMDPALINFLKTKKANTKCNAQEVIPDETNKPDTYRMDLKNSTDINLRGCANNPTMNLVNKWPHMDIVEPEKLKWMEELPPPKPPPAGVPYNARFSFDGTLLPYIEEIPQDGLYHHGEEPERPGYTLQELLQLSRSSVLQQRITSINTLANIFLKASDYTYCLEKPLLPQLLESEIFLLLRFSLDDSIRQVVVASIIAISNLLVNYADESCLERLLGVATGLKQPLFYVKLDLKTEDIVELKDPQLLKIDVIKGALRTQILPRFSYILKNLRIEPSETISLLKCLVRISRHSLESALSIANCPGLLPAVRNLLNKENEFNFSEALKLFRVIASHSHTLAEQLVNNYELLDPIQRYISGEQREELMSLVLESFYTWQVLLTYNLTTEMFLTFSPVIQRLLLAHVEHTSIFTNNGDHEHATALISTLSVILHADYNRGRQFLPTLELCALKWLTQISFASNITWTMCKLIGATLNCAAIVASKGEYNSKDVMIKVLKFLDSPNFMHCSNNLRKSSWLLFEYENTKVENLPCLGVVPPTVYDVSTFPLVAGLVSYLRTVADMKLSEKFISSTEIHNYLQDIIKANIEVKAQHWYARQEIYVLFNIIHIHQHVMSFDESSYIHEVALVLLPTIQNDDRYLLPDLFNTFIFNKKYFGTDISTFVSEFTNLNLANNSAVQNANVKHMLSEAIKNLDAISDCYNSVLGVNNFNLTFPPPSLTATVQGEESALPTDWQFIPLLQLYNSEGSGEKAGLIALTSLQWILILEMLRPEIVSATSISARYCRVACTFLAGNDLFRDVTTWLETILIVLLKYNSQLDFDQPIPGLTSFYDFFRQLMEHFSAVSYGNPVFGQYLLIPLQQRHNPKYRKIIWSEQAGILRILSTSLDQLIIPLENFLDPCETDIDILSTYLGSLAKGQVREKWCPVLYKVAVHHVAVFINLYADQPFTKSLLQKIKSLGNQDLRTLLLEYQYSEDME